MKMRQTRLQVREPKRQKRLHWSADVLKWFGFACVCLGTFGVAVLQNGFLHLEDYTNETLFAALEPGSELFGLTSAAIVCSLLAALVLPVYAKLLYEGWIHTSNVKRYLVRLLLCAAVSEIPYDLAMRGCWMDWSAQNPIWGLALALLMLEILKRYQRKGVIKVLFNILVIFAAAVWAVLLQSQLGIMFVFLAAMYHFFAVSLSGTILGGITLTILQFPAPFGMIVVYGYDGRKGKTPRRLFYILYPAQLLLFWLLRLLLT